MIMDSWKTSPGNLNSPRRPEHVDQRAAPSCRVCRNPPGRSLSARRS